MTLAISTVIDSIAELDVEGVNIKNLKNIPPSALRLTPLLFPNPGQELGGFTPTRQSYGGGSSALIDVDYDLNYIFLYCEMGSGRTGLDFEQDRMSKIQAILDAVLGIDTFDGGVDIMPIGSINFTGNIPDPSGNLFLGCQMTFHVKEFWR